MLWIKAFHIIFVVTWFAGLFYLPRLFVYHADTVDEVGHDRFVVMERKLFAIMNVGGVLAVLFGLALLALNPGLLVLLWLRVKLAVVAGLVVYHFYCLRLLRDFSKKQNKYSSIWYRWFNEVPALALIAIVLLAVLKRPL